MSETPGITAPKFTLPIAKTPATLTNPRVLVIFAKPKIGKTSLMAELEDNLILDLEKGTGYINALKIEIRFWPPQSIFQVFHGLFAGILIMIIFLRLKISEI